QLPGSGARDAGGGRPRRGPQDRRQGQDRRGPGGLRQDPRRRRAEARQGPEHLMSAVSDIPAPPQRSLGQRAPDLLVWGLVLLLLVIAVKPVEMGHITKLFTNSQNMREFGADLMHPNFDS